MHPLHVAVAPTTVFADAEPRERTLILVKPDGVQRGLVGEIISRFEKKGYKLVALKVVQPDKKLAETHYDDLRSRPFFNGLIKFFTSNGVQLLPALVTSPSS
jgi:nucleoside-diphosphate kinase